jgi:methyl acetate hydrolase
MRELDQLIVDAVAHENLPFAVAAVANAQGVLWEGSAGEANGSRAAGPDTVFRLFSQTKAIGGLAAMILVDRRQLSLETPVASVLPEFNAIQVLESMGPDGPVFRAPRRPVTLRHLLTHTSGLAYSEWYTCRGGEQAMNVKQHAYHEAIGSQHILNETFASLMSYPLAFDPGDGFVYGVGYEWLGLVVQGVDGRSIDRFCQEEIFEPLGTRDTMFEPDDARDRVAAIMLRGDDGHFAEFDAPAAFGATSVPAAHPEFYGMGQALYGTAPDYVRFLRMVLNRGELDGQRVISPETAELMMVNQMGDMSVPSTMKTNAPPLLDDVEWFPGTRVTHTAAFFRNESDIPDMRSAGSLTWAGFMNTHFWVDPAKDIAAVLMTQSLPFCEPGFMETYADFERAVYQEFAGSSAPGATADPVKVTSA